MTSRCDICQMGDGWRDMHLQRCKMCGVCFHGTCYGIKEENAKVPNYVCKACAAVGTAVPVRTKKGPDSVTSIIQEKRPTECVLCSVSNEIHAMHPIYDTHGRNGRQVVLPANEKKGLPQRLGWVHTLCAFVIIQNGSLVYACDAKGRYADENGEWVDSDAESTASDESDEESLVETHHFVECGKEDGEHTPWSRDIQEKQKGLTCSVCGKKDKVGSLRFAMQCTAGNEEEFFAEHHQDMGSDTCYVPLHVGCAMWGDKTGNGYRRVYFFPGSDDEIFHDPVAEVYCAAHAKDVSLGEEKKNALATGKKKLAAKGQQKKLSAKIVSANPPIKAAPRKNLAYERRLKKNSGKPLRPLKKARQASVTLLSSPPASKSSVADAAKPLKHAKTQKVGMDILKPQKIAKRRASDKAAEHVPNSQKRRHSAQDVSTLDEIESLAFPKRRGSGTGKTAAKAGETSKSITQRNEADNDQDWSSIVSKDVVEKLKSALPQGINAKEVTKECRSRWKETTGLPKSEFKKLWNAVKKHVQKVMGPSGGETKDRQNNMDNATEAEAPRPFSPVAQADTADDVEVASLEMPVEEDVTRDPGESRWKHLWVGDSNYSGDFEFGEWDSYRYSNANQA